MSNIEITRYGSNGTDFTKEISTWIPTTEEDPKGVSFEGYEGKYSLLVVGGYLGKILDPEHPIPDGEFLTTPLKDGWSIITEAAFDAGVAAILNP